MKRLFALLLAAVLCLSLAACGNGKVEANTDNSQGQNTENTPNESEQVETEPQGNGNTEQLTDERYQEGTDPADIDAKYVGVWYSTVVGSENKFEFFADGRIVVNDETEYRWKSYDGKMVEVYLNDKQCGVCYLLRDKLGDDFFDSMSELERKVKQNAICMETPEAEELMGTYTQVDYRAGWY